MGDVVGDCTEEGLDATAEAGGGGGGGGILRGHSVVFSLSFGEELGIRIWGVRVGGGVGVMG